MTFIGQYFKYMLSWCRSLGIGLKTVSPNSARCELSNFPGLFMLFPKPYDASPPIDQWHEIPRSIMSETSPPASAVAFIPAIYLTVFWQYNVVQVAIIIIRVVLIRFIFFSQIYALGSIRLCDFKKDSADFSFF